MRQCSHCFRIDSTQTMKSVDDLDVDGDLSDDSDNSARYRMLSNLKNNVLITHANEVKNLCDPLKQYGITGFIFMRHFPDGSFIDLSNQIPWSLFFLERFFAGQYETANVSDHIFVSEGISLWSCNLENVIWQEGQQLFNFGNGISIVVRQKAYKDIFCFYGSSSNYKLNNFYINNIARLRTFCNDFLTKSAKIIQMGHKNKLIIPQAYNPISHQSKRLLKENKPNTRLLSEKELRCIELSAKGLFAQEIAEALFISKRTVESHLANAKLKLNCKSTSELVYFTTKNHFIE